MLNRVSDEKTNRARWLPILAVTLIASILPQILLRQWYGSVPAALPYIKLAAIGAAGIFTYTKKQNGFTKYCVVLGVIILTEIQTQWIFSSPAWQRAVDFGSFLGNFGSSIFLKMLAVIPVLIVLRVLYHPFPDSVYLSKGDLSAPVEEISWLRIRKNQMTWGRLAVISALLISLGTLLLTLFTVIGTPTVFNYSNLLRYFPFILLLALLNSLCEGVQYRSAVLGALKDILPKDLQILTAAVFFGIGHFYGAPSGVVGVFMSGLLGWFMGRSMVETRGFVSSWLIHCMQDVVIFSTIVLLGGFS